MAKRAKRAKSQTSTANEKKTEAMLASRARAARAGEPRPPSARPTTRAGREAWKAEKERERAERSGEVVPASMEKLDKPQLVERLSAVHRLQKDVENRKIALAFAKRAAKAAKEELDDAVDALAKEIHEQRDGPGPLFNQAGEEIDGEAEVPGEAPKLRITYDDGGGHINDVGDSDPFGSDDDGEAT